MLVQSQHESRVRNPPREHKLRHDLINLAVFLRTEDEILLTRWHILDNCLRETGDRCLADLQAGDPIMENLQTKFRAMCPDSPSDFALTVGEQAKLE